MALEPGRKVGAKVHAGYGKAAAKLGTLVEIYRPTEAFDPLRLLDLSGTALAVFDSNPGFRFSTPAQAGNPIRFALVEGSRVQSGDYIIGETGRHFVADMPALQPIVCVICNATVTLLRPTASDDFGSTEPPGKTEEVEQARGWPASVLGARRGSGDDMQVPGDASPASHDVLLPAVSCIPQPRSGDVVADNYDRRFRVDAFEASALGWRLVVRLLAVA